MTEPRVPWLTAGSVLLLVLFQLPQAGQAVGVKSQGKAQSNMKMTGTRESPLACNALALNSQQRLRIRALLDRFHSSRQGIKELPSGYAVRLPADPSIIRDAAEYITLERQCCPFFDFALEAEREGGPVWLSLTGRAGVKEFARLEFGLQEHIDSTPDTSAAKESPLACNDSALSPSQLDRLVAVLKELRASKQETAELGDGYAIRLPSSAVMVQDVGEYMAILRLCSPYFETTLQVGCEGGQVWLRLCGREGVKALVKNELHI
jgi:hypothetical protein